MRDEAGDAILVFGTIDQTYTAGNQLPANSVVGTYKVYNQMAEIIPVEGVTWPTTETNADASPVEMTIDQLNAVTEAEWSTIASKLVVIKGAKVSADGSTITVGDAKFANVYAKRFNPTLENASAVYDVVGIIETHYNYETSTVLIVALNIANHVKFSGAVVVEISGLAELDAVDYIATIRQPSSCRKGNR